MKKITIVLADDHKIIREGLKALIEKHADLKVVAEAENGRDAVRMAQEHAPDIIIMDVAIPELNGMEATRQLLADSPGTKVIAFSMRSDRRFVTEMLKAGSVGYLLKDSAFEEMVKTIRGVMNGQIYLSPNITGTVVDDYIRRLTTPLPAANAPSLTPREREVLQLLPEGKSTKEIAAELTKYAVREGFTSL
ncbi:MAG: response regulator transcription factor [bacterium]|jgi:DNA-binding NarL/FixJ family response regulator|nr:response regulator transcription factor [bacterium]